jgi:hypothetical protein
MGGGRRLYQALPNPRCLVTASRGGSGGRGIQGAPAAHRRSPGLTMTNRRTVLKAGRSPKWRPTRLNRPMRRLAGTTAKMAARHCLPGQLGRRSVAAHGGGLSPAGATALGIQASRRLGPRPVRNRPRRAQPRRSLTSHQSGGHIRTSASVDRAEREASVGVFATVAPHATSTARPASRG